MAMRQAFQAGDASRRGALCATSEGHVLEPYAIYYQLHPQLGEYQRERGYDQSVFLIAIRIAR